MQQFIQRFGAKIQGVLSGFDRLRFRGTFRLLTSVSGMAHFLSLMKVQLKDFGRYAKETTKKIRTAVEETAEKANLEIQHVASAAESKEGIVRRILQERKPSSGLVCVLSCVEPCRTYDVYRGRPGKGCPDLVSRQRQCLHYYHYYLDPMFGLVHVRTQTWFPFAVHICVNGREWLARQLDAAKIGYLRHDNCFSQIKNVTRAQRIMDRQWHLHWSKHLKRLAHCSNPIMKQLFPKLEIPLTYYWTLEESEWATDVMFNSQQELEQLYPRLILHGVQTFGSREVMRFLGRKTPVTPGKYGNFAAEVISDLRTRAEGVRIKHRINRNSLKMYDKGGSVLRIETTINEPRDMKVFRHKEGDLKGPKKWRPMRKGIADIRRRVQISQAANERYLNSLAEVNSSTPLGEMLAKLCQPTKLNDRRVRALNPFAEDDKQLLETISRGEFSVNGFRNRDIRSLLFGSDDGNEDVRRRRSSAVSRKLRLLRAHHLIKKIPTTHRYQLTDFGRAVVTAITMAKNADTAKLAAVA
jgi:hypothetical protein